MTTSDLVSIIRRCGIVSRVDLIGRSLLPRVLIPMCLQLRERKCVSRFERGGVSSETGGFFLFDIRSRPRRRLPYVLFEYVARLAAVIFFCFGPGFLVS